MTAALTGHPAPSGRRKDGLRLPFIETFTSIMISLVTGLLSGWISGATVTRHYRKLDERHELQFLHIKYLESSTIHLARILGEIELLEQKENEPPDYENLLREIGVIQIPDGKLDEKHGSASIIQEKDRLLSEIEKKVKDGSIDLRQTALRLIRLSVKLMAATEEYRREIGLC